MIGRRTGRLGVAVALALAACRGGEPRTPSRLSASAAIVKITSAVPDAGLWIDGRFIGSIGALRAGVALDPGPHRVELRHEAYFVAYQELELTPGQRLTVDLELAPLLP